MNLASQGLNGDVIAARVGLNKNRLRARHALELHAGRQKRKAEKEAAAATALTKKEAARLECIEASFRSDWYTKEFGNDLYGGTHTVEDALAWCKARGFDKWE